MFPFYFYLYFYCFLVFRYYNAIARESPDFLLLEWFFMHFHWTMRSYKKIKNNIYFNFTCANALTLPKRAKTTTAKKIQSRLDQNHIMSNVLWSNFFYLLSTWISYQFYGLICTIECRQTKMSLQSKQSNEIHFLVFFLSFFQRCKSCRKYQNIHKLTCV